MGSDNILVEKRIEYSIIFLISHYFMLIIGEETFTWNEHRIIITRESFLKIWSDWTP